MHTFDWQGFEARDFAVNGITLHARVSADWDNTRPVLLPAPSFSSRKCLAFSKLTSIP